MTITFTQKAERADWHDQPEETITMTTEAVELAQILEVFERFLKGAGYCFKGHIEAVDDEEVHP